MKHIISSILIVIAFSIMACTKHRGDVAQPPAAVNVVFASPTTNGVYSINDSIVLQGTAIAAHTLHGYDLVIKKAADTTVYFSKHVHDHNDTLLIHHKWKAALAKGEDLQLQVTFALDHDGNKFTKSVGFKVR